MTTTRAFHAPPGLTPGARVAVIAPASSFDRASFESGLACIGGALLLGALFPTLRHASLAGPQDADATAVPEPAD